MATSAELALILSARDRASGPLRKLGANVKTVGKSINTMNSAASRIGSVAVVGLGALAGAALKTGVSYNVLKQNALLAFTTLLKDGGKAQAMIAQIEETAKKTPFAFEDLTRASQRLLAFGFAGEDVIPILTTIGDAVSAMGGGAEMIDRVTMAFGQMQTKGKVSGEEMMQLAEAGIPAWQILAENVELISPKLAAAAKAAGWTQQQIIQKLQKMGEAGKLPAAAAIAALRKGMATRFGGLGEAQSKTTGGAVSALSDALRELFGALSEGPLKTITGWMITLADEVPKITKAFKDLPEPVKDVLGWFATIGAAIAGSAGVVAVIGALTGALGVGSGLAGILGTVGTALGTFVGVAGPLGLLAAAFAVAKLAYDRNVQPIFDALALYMTTFPHVKIGLDWANAQAKVVADWIMSLGPVVSGAVKIAVAWASKAAEDVVDWLGKAAETIKAAVAVSVNWASQAAYDLADWVTNLPAAVAQTVSVAYQWVSQTAYDLAVWVQTKIGEFAQTVTVAWSWLSQAAYDLGAWVQTRIGEFTQTIAVAFSWFSQTAYDLATWVQTKISTFVQTVKVAWEWFSGAAHDLANWVNGHIGVFATTLKLGIEWVSDTARKIFEWLSGAGKALVGGSGSGGVVTIVGNNPLAPGYGPANQMAAGGIVTSPTLALIGEAGPEAVVPLSGRGAMGGGNVTINFNNYGVLAGRDADAWFRSNLDRARKMGALA